MTTDMSQFAEPVLLDWDNAKENLLGTITVVEIQHLDATGVLMKHDHVYGRVIVADQEHGIRIEVLGQTFNGKMMILPAQLDSFTRPRPGSYKLRSTGEVVTDPHWFTTWMITDTSAVKAQRFMTAPMPKLKAPDAANIATPHPELEVDPEPAPRKK